MSNNPMQMIAQMMMQAKGCGSPEQFTQNLLKNNPQFANKIQGQNPKQLAMQGMKEMGININDLNKLLNQ